MAAIKDYLDEKQLKQATKLINFARQHKRVYEIKGQQINDPHLPRIYITVYDNTDKIPSMFERSIRATWFFNIKSKNPEAKDFGSTISAAIGNNSKEYQNFERFFNALPKLFWIRDQENIQIASELLKIARDLIA